MFEFDFFTTTLEIQVTVHIDDTQCPVAKVQDSPAQ